MKPKYLLPIIIFAQFAGTSLWFAVNAVLKDLQKLYIQMPNFLANMTSTVQIGFVLGTFVYALLTLSDRFSPVRVFVTSTLLAAICNLLTIFSNGNFEALIIFRFLVGFFLSGVYPVGMKIMADWHEQGLGRALGYLVGALVLGTSFAHFIAIFSLSLNWQTVIIITSTIATVGAFLMAIFIKDGPYRRKAGKFKPSAIIEAFKHKPFRIFALGYFGHMFELYTFWAFVPIMLNDFNKNMEANSLSVSLWAFLIIASGLIGCIITGELSTRINSAYLAFICLSISLVCCVISVFMHTFSPLFFVVFMFIWGISVVGDSPQFSTLIAQNSPSESRASAITIVNCIGFAITVVSLQITHFMYQTLPLQYVYLVLAIGPIIGLISTFKQTFSPKND